MRLKYLALLCAIVFSLYGCLGEEAGTPLTSASDDNSSLQKVTVTYDANGGMGEMSAQSVEAGADFVLNKNTFAKKEHSFVGWSKLSSSMKADYPDEAKISLQEDITLFAIWAKSADTVKVTFNSNGGTGYMPVLNAKKYTSINIPANQYVRDGYIFLGWSKNSSSYEASYNDKGLLSIEDKDITLYAVWKERANAHLRTVTYNANGGVGEPYSKEYAYGERVQLDTNKFTNGNKKFVGWAKSPTDRNYLISDNGFIFPYDDITLYAVWSDNAHKIMFDGNGGNGSMEPIYAENGQTISLPNYNFERWNHTLEGYTYDKDDYMPRYRAGEDYTMGDQDVTLYIQWRIINAAIGGASQEFKGQTKFVKGVNIPEDVVWGPGSEFNNGNYMTGWRKDFGVYNVIQGWWNLCWAATASNIIHWWLEHNDKYIKAFGYTGPKEYRHYNEGRDVYSEIFQLFSNSWPNTGNKPTIGVTWFLKGLSTRGDAGYFKEVFEGHQLATSFTASVNRRTFNETITDALKNDKALAYVSNYHAMTVWGADYDADGYVTHIYVTDSNYVGVYKERIVYDDENQKVLSSFGGLLTTITDIISVDLGQEIWEEYFRKKGITVK